MPSVAKLYKLYYLSERWILFNFIADWCLPYPKTLILLNIETRYLITKPTSS